MWTYRVKYAKLGRIRFISHLDVMRAIIRAVHRANIPIAYTEGFNPRPKLSMGPALTLGVESTCEMADLVLARMLPPDELHQRLTSKMPHGLDALDTQWVLGSSPRLSDATSASYMIQLEEKELVDSANERIREFHAKEVVRVERVRKDSSALVDMKPFILTVRMDAHDAFHRLWLSIALGGSGSCSPVEAVQAVLNVLPDRAKRLPIVRTEIGFGERRTPGKDP